MTATTSALDCIDSLSEKTMTVCESSIAGSNSSLLIGSKVKCTLCGQECVPGRGLTTHMNWNKRNTTATVLSDTSQSHCRVCGKVARSARSACVKDHTENIFIQMF